MLHPDRNPLSQSPRNHRAVTMLRAGLEAEETGAPARLHQFLERHQVVPGGERLQVRGVNPPELGVAATPCGRATLGGRAQAPEVEILDASRGKVRREGG